MHQGRVVPRGKSQEEEEVAAEEMSMADPKPAPSRLPTWFQSPWSERTTLGLLALLLIDVALALWGFIQSWVYNYKPGAYGNNFTGVWINGFVFLLCAQAVAVLALPQLVTSRPARFWAWMWYTCWLSVAGLICLIGMHAPGMASQYAWTFLWYPHLVVLAAAALARRRSARAAGVTTVDVEASGTPQQQQEKPRACTKEAWRQCWSNYWIFVAWSSLWWVAFLGFFLALQAGFLVTDSYRYPPPGTLYPVPQEDGTGYVPNIHMLCKGPRTPGLSTFILEAGGGAPGIVYAGLADALAAGGRRVCWYDRLGYGWSDDMWLDPADTQSTVTLYNLLKVADEPGPYIIAGHSGGGQLGMIFAGTHPTLVKGLALLDSFDSIAIALGYMGSYNVTVTLKNGETVVRPKFTYLTPERGALVDVLRAISPLAWARFITNTGASSNYTYAGASDAVYGNNKEWQAQWVLIHAANNGVEDMSDQLSRLGGRRFWQGTGWPNFGAMPVLLLPAAGTFKPWLPPGCTPETLVANTTCQAEVLADPAAHIYPHLYLSYFDTLSSNVSMVVMPGAHSFPSVVPQLAADRLLEKFAGV